MSNLLLTELNAFRAADGKAEFADWRKARHLPMLEAYRAAQAEGQYLTVDFVDGDEPDALMIDEDGELVRESELTDTSVVDNMYPEVLAPSVLDAIHNNDFANEAIAEALKAEKTASYKELRATSGSTSLVDKPVGFVHQFLTEHPTLTRKQAVAGLVAFGVNYSTARTQYQRWYTANKKAGA